VYERVTVIPVRYKFKNVEWVPRERGGGFVQSFNREDTPTNEFDADPLTGRIKHGSNQVVPTSYYLCLHEEENYSKIIIGMSSTQLRKARRWNAMMEAVKDDAEQIPMYACRYELSTIVETNAKGKWYGWNIKSAGYVTEQIFNQAKEVHEKMLEFLPERLIAASRVVDKEDDDI
jgi:hypothetical protein